jgi:hypothetical protein
MWRAATTNAIARTWSTDARNWVIADVGCADVVSLSGAPVLCALHRRTVERCRFSSGISGALFAHGPSPGPET